MILQKLKIDLKRWAFDCEWLKNIFNLSGAYFRVSRGQTLCAGDMYQRKPSDRTAEGDHQEGRGRVSILGISSISYLECCNSVKKTM